MWIAMLHPRFIGFAPDVASDLSTDADNHPTSDLSSEFPHRFAPGKSPIEAPCLAVRIWVSI